MSDGSSRGEESASRESRTRGACPDREIPGQRSVCKSVQAGGGHGTATRDRHELFRSRQVCSAFDGHPLGSFSPCVLTVLHRKVSLLEIKVTFLEVAALQRWHCCRSRC